MDSQVTRSRQRILESALVLLREGNLPGQLVEAVAAAARVPLANAQQFFQNDQELFLLSREVSAAPIDVGIVRVKAAAKNVPA
jgi:DNA-binding transcriptional regulator YbjK